LGIELWLEKGEHPEQRYGSTSIAENPYSIQATDVSQSIIIPVQPALEKHPLAESLLKKEKLRDPYSPARSGQLAFPVELGVGDQAQPLSILHKKD
jgi:hypothetical protein